MSDVLAEINAHKLTEIAELRAKIAKLTLKNWPKRQMRLVVSPMR